MPPGDDADDARMHVERRQGRSRLLQQLREAAADMAEADEQQFKSHIAGVVTDTER
jgi:hypothetical protein